MRLEWLQPMNSRLEAPDAGRALGSSKRNRIPNGSET
jgi:hypothetical protein